MRLIDVFTMMARGEIKQGTVLVLGEVDGIKIEYIYDETRCGFYDEYDRLEHYYDIHEKFLNREIKLIPPKEKKYLVKFNMRGWIDRFRYLNYYEKNESIEMNTKSCNEFAKTHFTKSELQSIQLVREFLEDMEGKYELIEVKEDESMDS